MEINTQQSEEEVSKSIEKILKVWGRLATLLQGLLILFGFLAICCSVCIGAFTGLLGTRWIKILAASSTLLLTLISSFQLPSKAGNLRDGWRHLNKAFYNYKCKSINISQLITAYKEGEEIVGNIVFSHK